MRDILTIAQYASAISGILAAVVLLVKPVQEKVIGIGQVRDGQKCLLRQQMLNTYYKHQAEKKLRQYEYENFQFSYAAYKALGGNSFVDKIHEEIEEWTVVS